MNTKQTEALKLALEDLLLVWKDRPSITAIREALAEQPAIKQDLTPEQPAQQQTVAWAETAMRLAADLSIESLRLGSYERKDTYENVGRASWQTIEIREKREAARERLRQHVYTSPPASKPWVGLTDEERAQLYCDWPTWTGFARAIEAKLKEKNA